MTTENQTLTEEVKGLFEQAGLDGQASEKLSSLFEASVTAKVNQIKEQVVSEMETIKVEMQEQKEVEISEAVEESKKEIAEQVAAFLDYTADEWMENNKLALESAIRVEVAETFISKMLTVFKENYVDLPEEKFDLVSSLKEQVAKLQTGLNEQVEKNVQLSKTLKEQARGAVFASVTKDLTDTEVEKFAGLVEGIDYENDDTYSEKLSMIKETYIRKTDDKSKSVVLDFDDLEEEEIKVVPDGMKSLVEGLDLLAPRI